MAARRAAIAGLDKMPGGLVLPALGRRRSSRTVGGAQPIDRPRHPVDLLAQPLQLATQTDAHDPYRRTTHAWRRSQTLTFQSR
jgi:hypothetical protein